MIVKYLLTLSIGHILGDFYFQNEKMAKEKDEKFSGILKHSAVYILCVLVVILPVISLDMVLAAVYLSVTHFMIDAIKFFLLKNKKIKKSGKTFICDQCAHLICILILAYIMYCWNFEITGFKFIKDIQIIFGINTVLVARWVLAIMIIHKPANIFIQSILYGYKPKEDDELIRADNRAGRRIGTVERLLMLLFIAMDQYAAMGLVLTAKSIARYDKIAKDEKFAEYYLLGTLLSTVCVVVCKVVIL